jgi:hypothetical protein
MAEGGATLNPGAPVYREKRPPVGNDDPEVGGRIGAAGPALLVDMGCGSRSGVNVCGRGGANDPRR